MNRDMDRLVTPIDPSIIAGLLPTIITILTDKEMFALARRRVRRARTVNPSAPPITPCVFRRARQPDEAVARRRTPCVLAFSTRYYKLSFRRCDSTPTRTVWPERPYGMRLADP